MHYRISILQLPDAPAPTWMVTVRDAQGGIECCTSFDEGGRQWPGPTAEQTAHQLAGQFINERGVMLDFVVQPEDELSDLIQRDLVPCNGSV